ncbi:unnamed protein product, partial [Dicrocoelium dendriticum]
MISIWSPPRLSTGIDPYQSWRKSLHFDGAKQRAKRLTASANLSSADWHFWDLSQVMTMSSAYSKLRSRSPGSSSTHPKLCPVNVISMTWSKANLKAKGDNRHPCLTPLEILKGGDSSPEALILLVIRAYNAQIICTYFSGTPFLSRQSQSAHGSTESKAPLMSRNTTTVGSQY